MKTCKKCGEEKPKTSDYFPKRKGSEDGLRGDCKKCYKESQKKYREKNKEKVEEYHRNYYRENKTMLLDKAKAYYNSNTMKIYNYQKVYNEKNKEHIKIRQKEYASKRKDIKRDYDKVYREMNKEKLDAQRNIYRAKTASKELKRIADQRRRAKVKNLPNDLTIIQWEETKTFFKNRCCYCGENDEILHQDHAIPLCKNGGYTQSNIIPACPRCNLSKNDSDLFEWFGRQSFYTIEKEQLLLGYFGKWKKKIEVV